MKYFSRFVFVVVFIIVILFSLSFYNDGKIFLYNVTNYEMINVVANEKEVIKSKFNEDIKESLSEGVNYYKVSDDLYLVSVDLKGDRYHLIFNRDIKYEDTFWVNRVVCVGSAHYEARVGLVATGVFANIKPVSDLSNTIFQKCTKGR